MPFPDALSSDPFKNVGTCTAFFAVLVPLRFYRSESVSRIKYPETAFFFKQIAQKGLLSFGECAKISFVDTQLYAQGRQRRTLVFPERTKKVDSTEYYVVKQRALPEVLLKVVEAKRLVESKKSMSVQEAVDKVGISRSSFYKYKDDIFKFHDNAQGSTITITMDMEDEPGALSDVLKVIAESGANILTIHQSIPINGVAAISISIQVLETTKNVSDMLTGLEAHTAVHHVKIVAGE